MDSPVKIEDSYESAKSLADRRFFCDEAEHFVRAENESFGNNQCRDKNGTSHLDAEKSTEEDNLAAAKANASRAVSSDTPSISNITRPGFTRQAQNSTEPLPLP